MSLSNPLVTVLMPVYNGEKFLAEAIKSILKQTFKDFELLIIDDCSTDNSCDIINFFKDSRIQLIKNKNNIGQSRTMNNGIKISKGKYIARIDQDDCSAYDRLEKQFNLIKNSNLSVVGTWCEKINLHSEIIGYINHPIENDDIINSMAIDSPFSHSSVIINKQHLIDNGLYSEIFNVAMDWDLWIKLATKGYKFYNIPEYLTKIRFHESQATADFNFIDERLYLIDKGSLLPVKNKYYDYNRAWKLFYMIKRWKTRLIYNYFKSIGFHKTIYYSFLFVILFINRKIVKSQDKLYTYPSIYK